MVVHDPQSLMMTAVTLSRSWFMVVKCNSCDNNTYIVWINNQMHQSNNPKSKMQVATVNCANQKTSASSLSPELCLCRQSFPNVKLLNTKTSFLCMLKNISMSQIFLYDVKFSSHIFLMLFTIFDLSHIYPYNMLNLNFKKYIYYCLLVQNDRKKKGKITVACFFMHVRINWSKYFLTALCMFFHGAIIELWQTYHTKEII